MLDIKTFVNGYETIKSGMVHVLGDTINFVVDTMPVTVVFVHDGGSPTWAVKAEGASVKLILNNFTKTTGQGMFNPVLIGQTGGREIRMTFYAWAFDVGQDHKMLSYAFLLGPAKND